MRVGRLEDKVSQGMMATLGMLIVVFAVGLYFRVNQLAEAALVIDPTIL